MKMNVVVIAVLTCCAVLVESAYFIPGPCPDARSEGDLWVQGCNHCQCLQNGYTCGGCSSAIIPAPDGCTKTPYNISLTYPDCCPQVVC